MTKTLAQFLEPLADRTVFDAGLTAWSRWGEMLRSDATIAPQMTSLLEEGRLRRLGTLGRIRGGAVTRANAYFLVKEREFSGIPARMRVTHSDLARIAVAEDGIGHLFKIERRYLRPVLKGPDSLMSAFAVPRTSARLVDIPDSKADLEASGRNGALAYLRRGETQSYKVSSDELKGGVPAERSQIRNRKPFWYSIQTPRSGISRIVFPEHIDRRYVFTLVEEGDDSVVIDKLFQFEGHEHEDTPFIHAVLNSLVGWYQTELRGRSQLGEGVLELKIPDYQGILVPSPRQVPDKARVAVMNAFAALSNAGASPSFEELGSQQRFDFDRAVVAACGFSDPDETVLLLERALRALAGERVERKHSVADAKISRRKSTNVAATIDAQAARIAASLPAYPDPREFLEPDQDDERFMVVASPAGPITIGTELFDVGAVKSGDVIVVQTSSVTAANLARGILLIDPTLRTIDLPKGKRLERASKDWTSATQRWLREYEAVAGKVLAGVNDQRIRESIKQQALKIMHAA